VQLRLHPRTLSGDGDPCDVLVLSPMPLITGVVVRCRPIGMLKLDDEAGGDAKILAVPSTSSPPCTATCSRPRPAGNHDPPDCAFLRALQGSRTGQMVGWQLGRRRRSQAEIVDGVARYAAEKPKA
jgi:inorganic pyrophosphatase